MCTHCVCLTTNCLCLISIENWKLLNPYLLAGMVALAWMNVIEIAWCLPFLCSNYQTPSRQVCLPDWSSTDLEHGLIGSYRLRKVQNICKENCERCTIHPIIKHSIPKIRVDTQPEIRLL